MTIHQLHPQGHPLTWQERLDDAATEHDVLQVVRDYLATVTHEEYTSLPPALRPGKIVDANDVTTYAFDLVREECHDEGIQHIVQRLGHVLSRASIRLSQIMVGEHRAPPQQGQSQRASD